MIDCFLFLQLLEDDFVKQAAERARFYGTAFIQNGSEDWPGRTVESSTDSPGLTVYSGDAD